MLITSKESRILHPHTAVPVKRWSYFSGCPGVCILYFLGGSVDFFYSVYHSLLKSTKIGEESVRFQIIKKKDLFLCEIAIEIPSQAILEKFVQFLRTSEQEFGTDISRMLRKRSTPFSCETYLSPLKAFDEAFFYARSTKHLVSLTQAFFYLQSVLEHEQRASALYIRLIKARLLNGSEEEAALGIFIGFKSPHDHQDAIHEQKLLQVVQAIVPGVVSVPNAFMYCDKFIYFEVKKILGGRFSWHELGKLRTSLLRDLQSCIFSFPHAVHFPDDEEEIFNHITRLGNEVQSIYDLPHILITFQNVRGKLIFFNLTIVFICTNQSEILQNLEKFFPTNITIVPKHQLSIGHIDKEHFKYASVFSIEMDSLFFQRQNNHMDLIGARSYLAKILENVVGPYRDCNGGLLQKRTQQLDLIRESLGEKGYEYTTLLESFFYSLTPFYVQAIIPTEIARELFFLFLESYLRRTKEKRGYTWSKKELPNALLLVVRSNERSLIDSLLLQTAAFKKTSSLTGKALIEIEGSSFFCFFQVKADVDVDHVQQLCAILEEESQSDSDCISPLSKKRLMLNFHDGIPFSLNPQMIRDLRQHTLFSVLFECLTRVDDNRNVEMAAAQKVEVSACGTCYTFHLRPLQWSNGEKLTAHHFAFAWKKALQPQSGSPRVDIFYPILNAEKAKRGEIPIEQVGIHVKDVDTLVVNLERPNPYFLELLAHPLASPLYGEHTEPLFFNGPFLASPLEQGRLLRLVRNPFYWNTQNIYLDSIDIYAVRSGEEALKLFKNDQLDLLGDPLSPLPSAAFEDDQIRKSLIRRPVWRPYYIYCNTTCFPLHHAKIRNALSLSIDRQALAQQLNWEHAPLFSPIPPPLSLLTADEKADDTQKAQALFAEALEELSLSPSRFPTLVFHLDDASTFKQIGRALSARWKEVLGINVQVEYMPWASLFANFETGKYQMAGMFQTAFYRDSRFYLSMFKESSRLVNRPGWINSEYIGLLQQSERAPTQERANNFLREAEQMLIRETVVIPVLSQTYNFLLKERIKNFKVSDFGFVDLMKISID